MRKRYFGINWTELRDEKKHVPENKKYSFQNQVCFQTFEGEPVKIRAECILHLCFPAIIRSFF